MRNLSIVLFLIIPILSIGQVKLKTKTLKSRELGTVEKFGVLKSNNSIRQGEYQKTKNGKLLERGIYNNGKKEAFQYYDFDGSCFLEYDYDNNVVVSYKEPENYEYYLDLNGRTKADRLPLPLFSPYELRLFIANNVKYPVAAQENGLSGISKVAISISDTGNIMSVSLFESSHKELDEESLRIMKLLSTDWKWIPAQKNGKAIQTYIIVPVKFVLY
nr:energy transducer TonB [uncultured Draconibacterium sp.]